MIDEVSYGSKKPNPGSKNFVYLGGKTIFRKFLADLKASFKKYTIKIFSFYYLPLQLVVCQANTSFFLMKRFERHQHSKNIH